MKQVNRILSTYTADVMGVSSALYELGGLIVMHDPSGCNSTYATHDEPRWFTKPSAVYISALEQFDALLGRDEKLINDIAETAVQLKPEFIAIAGTIIPSMLGTDFKAVAKLVEQRTGIPAFGFATNSMHSYVSGANTALAEYARRFCPDETAEEKESGVALGMDKIYTQLISGLEEAGVKSIEAVGQEFNPDFHNAVMHVEDENFGENIVAEELQKGYMYKDTVVRHSMVKVAN